MYYFTQLPESVYIYMHVSVCIHIRSSMYVLLYIYAYIEDKHNAERRTWQPQKAGVSHGFLLKSILQLMML